MNQTQLSGTPRAGRRRPASIQRSANITHSQVIRGNNNVIINGNGNVVTNKIVLNQKPKISRRPAPVIYPPRPDHPIRLLDRTAEKQSVQGSLRSGAPLEFFGPPGNGKSTLLRYISSQMSLADGMAFLELRSAKKLQDVLQQLFEAFYKCNQNYIPSEVELTRFFADVRALVLLDDCSLTREDLQSLRYSLPRCVLLTASSEQHLWGEGNAIPLRGLPDKDAMQLFQQQLGRRVGPEELPAIQRLCAALGGNPLEVIQAAGAVRNQGKPLAQLITEFAAAGLKESLLGLSISKLPDTEKNLLAVLAVVGTAPLPAEHLAEILQTADLASLVKDLLERGLIKAHSPRYGLTGSLNILLGRTWNLARWNELVLGHFLTWSVRTLSPEAVIDASEATFAVLENAAQANRWREVLQIGQAVEPLFALGRRWGDWERVLQFLLRAGQALGERGIEAWALHELGSRALCMDQFQAARDLLSRALQIRRAIGDRAGIADTQHNLAQLPSGIPPRNPPGTHKGPISFNGWIIGLVIGAAILGASLLGPQLFPSRPKKNSAVFPLLPSTAASTLTPAETATPTETVTPVIAPSFASTPTNAPTFTDTPTVTPTPTPAFNVLNGANCRQGPSTLYDIVTTFPAGQQLQIVGKSAGSPRWWLVQVPGPSYLQCWISPATGNDNGATANLPVASAPPPPTFTPTPTWTPTWTPTPTQIFPPSAPTGFNVQVNSCVSVTATNTLTWYDASNEEAYYVYRDGNIVAKLPANTNSYVDSPPSYKFYTYYVEAVNSAGSASSSKQAVDDCTIK